MLSKSYTLFLLPESCMHQLTRCMHCFTKVTVILVSSERSACRQSPSRQAWMCTWHQLHVSLVMQNTIGHDSSQ
ncbi:hypothetical protein E2C01_009143 [Portunus trituberculatus]|uniref:Uncharacterized protein n=1 Tax=Portunus trituberculatus TaxID=210409 RepID=A0A5B7D4L3_PORTR|nr:hypothetical protein [Portunus trituberculatus]